MSQLRRSQAAAAPCPACDASGLPEGELRAWRRALHADGLTRITATPRPYPLPVLPAREVDPAAA